MNDESGFLQGKNRSDTIYLLALQPLAEGTVGVFNAPLIEICGKIAACTSQVIVRVGPGLPDT
jgi:hypothetical protein